MSIEVLEETRYSRLLCDGVRHYVECKRDMNRYPLGDCNCRKEATT